MANIYDVSRQAGVSTATVSRVLNNHPKVDPDLRRRVLAAVRELQYVPSGAARSLATGRTRRVALVIPDITNPFYPELARGAQDALDAAGHHLILSNTDDDRGRESRYLGMLSETGIDGLIIIPALHAGRPAARRAAPALAAQLAALGVPVVGITPEQVTPEADQVTVDETAAAGKAVSHLLGLGHLRVALINGPEDSAVGRARGAGYRDALARFGLTLDPALVRFADFRREGGRAAMEVLLAQPEPPTAVFAANDLMALGALSALHAAGKRVPHDVALAGIDNIAESMDADPPLTTVAVPRNYEYGRLAAELLLERLTDPRGPAAREPRLIRLDTRLIVRGSTVAGLGAR